MGDLTTAIESYIGPHTTVYNLSGKMVLPGFIDTHIHLGLAAQLMAGVDLVNCSSISDIQDTPPARMLRNISRCRSSGDLGGIISCFRSPVLTNT